MASYLDSPVFKRAAERILTQNGSASVESSNAPRPKYGDKIFIEDGAPRDWGSYVGQKRAKALLRAAIASAKFRGARLDHVMIAAGAPGVGKSALSRLVAFEMGVGMVETQGAVSLDEAYNILRGMKDGDIWFIDEAHQLVQGGKKNAEWLLAFLQDGVITTAEGVKEVPDVTVIAATTDAQMLPETILQRFVLRPIIEDYSREDAAGIALKMSEKIFTGIGLDAPSLETCAQIATAANNSPRSMKSLLSLLRDAEISGMAERDSNGDSDLAQTFEFAGVSPDGLDKMAQDYLSILLVMCKGIASSATIAAQMGESTVPLHTEKMLMSRGLIEITPKGRKLTEYGTERAVSLLKDAGVLTD